MPVRIPVVVVRHEAEPPLFEKDRTIGVHQVGLVLIDQVFDAKEVVLLPLRGHSGWIPRVLRGLVRFVVQAEVAGIGAVVGYAFESAFLVGPVAGLKPVIADSQVLADAEAQSMIERGLAKQPDDVLLRPHLHRVPWIQLRVP